MIRDKKIPEFASLAVLGVLAIGVMAVVLADYVRPESATGPDGKLTETETAEVVEQARLFEPMPSQITKPVGKLSDHETAVHGSASRVAEALREGATVRACAAVSADIVELVHFVSNDAGQLRWAIARAEACLPMLAGLDAQRAFLEALAKAAPGNGRLLELLGRQQLFLGLAEEAVATLEKAVSLRASREAWDLVASAKLSLAQQASGDDAQSLLKEAESALDRALASPGNADPWTLARMAEVQLALGNRSEAVSWADRAVGVARSGGAVSFAETALYMKVGTIQFRAGMTETGIAYMNQAISMAATEEQREQYRAMKRSVIGGAG